MICPSHFPKKVTVIDQKTLEGWTGAANAPEKRRKAAIHPSGHDIVAYNKSGEADAARVLKYAKEGDVIMDYGCGDGRVMQHIKTHQVIGVDAVPDMAKIVGGFTPDQFIDKVDLIYCLSVFIHNSHETGAEIIKWMVSRLRPGGTLLLQIPLYDVAKQPSDWIDVGVWTPDMLRKVAKDNKLKVLEIHTNNGAFSFQRVGPNHYQFQVLKYEGK